MAATTPVLDGYRSVSPYLCVRGAEAAIAFYADVFGAVERSRIAGPDGSIGHAEFVIGDSVVMLSDEFPDWGIRGPAAYGGTAVTIGVYVADVDAAYGRAVALGAQPVRPSRISSAGTGPFSTRGATGGASRRTSRTSPTTRSPAAPPRSWAAADGDPARRRVCDDDT